MKITKTVTIDLDDAIDSTTDEILDLFIDKRVFDNDENGLSETKFYVRNSIKQFAKLTLGDDIKIRI